MKICYFNFLAVLFIFNHGLSQNVRRGDTKNNTTIFCYEKHKNNSIRQINCYFMNYLIDFQCSVWFFLSQSVVKTLKTLNWKLNNEKYLSSQSMINFENIIEQNLKTFSEIIKKNLIVVITLNICL